MREIFLLADTSFLYKVLDFVRQFAEDHEFDEVLPQIELAVEEVFTNIANYAYNEGSGTVKIVCEVEQVDNMTTKADKLKISFMDKGIPYNPLSHDDPDINLPAEQRQIGGLGIFLTKAFMDTVVYEYEGGKNILIIKKGRSRSNK